MNRRRLFQVPLGILAILKGFVAPAEPWAPYRRLPAPPGHLIIVSEPEFVGKFPAYTPISWDSV